LKNIAIASTSVFDRFSLSMEFAEAINALADVSMEIEHPKDAF
jgi:hypothetical protein